MKGIILAGGNGTRLRPITLGVSKQLLPIYDKPMIYYPLSVLMLAGIQEIQIISSPQDIDGYEKLLGNGSQFGLKLSYKIQPSPDGLAQAFILGEEFIGNDSVCLILGDNIFYGQSFSESLHEAVSSKEGATVFCYRVNNPEDFGVINFNDAGEAIHIEEKPSDPKSNFAITGLYFYDNDIVKIANTIKPSKRNELEITDVNNYYLLKNNLDFTILPKESVWFDAGTSDSLLEASNYIQAILNRQNIQIGCPEEAAYKKNYINKKKLIDIISKMPVNKYSLYLKEFLKSKT